MKTIYLILLIASILCSCSNSKSTVVEGSEKTSIESEKMKEYYVFNIEVIDNRMPSQTPRKYMYAIVSLRLNSGNLDNNWRLTSFEINGVKYTKFDSDTFGGKNELLYRNNIREIPKNIQQPLSGEVQFENQDGDNLTFKVDNIKVSVVY